jgi:hypothetical protein
MWSSTELTEFLFLAQEARPTLELDPPEVTMVQMQEQDTRDKWDPRRPERLWVAFDLLPVRG